MAEIVQTIGRGSNGFKRAYKACISCRKGKAKCEVELDSAACARCRREQKECVFPVERSAKRRRVSSSPNHRQTSKSRYVRRNLDRPIEQAADEQRSQPQGEVHPSNTQSDPQLQNLTPIRADVAQTTVRSSSDAIGILFTAADERGSEEDGLGIEDDEILPGANGIADTPFSNLTSSVISPGKATLCRTNPENLQLWSEHRFVRQGWFSAREAITYIDLFFKNLSHLSPVADQFYADHKNHKRLILEEPLLCCTLLMISSRYHILPGPGGTSRAEFIHHRLWKHCEHLIQRILLGMEKYSTAKTRTLASIKALLLITEWHPRALHFPPENDGWDSSLAPSIDDSYNMHDRSTESSRRWREEVFEPAKRSDRMSWMLTGLACTLAHELGLFEDDQSNITNLDRRYEFRQIRKLLFLYTNQLSVRLGCTSIYPQTGIHQVASSPSSLEASQTKDSHDRDLMLDKWIEITKISKTASEMFFSPAQYGGKRKYVLSKRYLSLIEHFEPLLAHWQEEFKLLSLPTITEAARQILLIEYHHVELFVSSTALQALVERVGDRTSTNLWRDYDFIRTEYGQDFKFIKKVQEASCQIIAIASQLADNDILQLSPVRLFLRIVTASILLLKSISLGARDQDVTSSLDVLDQCIEALKTKKADDMHLSTRFGILIARHVRRFRQSFRVQSGLGAAITARNTGRTSNRQIQPQEVFTDQPVSADLISTDYNVTQQDISTDTTIVFDPPDDPSMEAWLAQPFDPDFAPFGFDLLQPAAGLSLDSLDFLWNLPVSE